MTTLKAVKSLNDSDILYNNTVLSKNYGLYSQIEKTYSWGDRRHEYLNTLRTHFNKKLAEICADYNFADYSRVFSAYDPIYGHAGNLIDGSTKMFQNFVYMAMFEHFVEHLDTYSPDQQKEYFRRLTTSQCYGLYSLTPNISDRLENELSGKLPPSLVTLCFGDTEAKFYQAYKASKKVYKKYLLSLGSKADPSDSDHEYLKDCAKSAWIRDGCKTERYPDLDFNIFYTEFPQKVVYGEELED
jgi:hypothetical protein